MATTAAARVHLGVDCCVRRDSSSGVCERRRACPVVMSSCSSRRSNPSLKISMCSQVDVETAPVNRERRRRSGTINSQETMDVWMRESVTEIVKKLPESPLLVQVFSDTSGSGQTLKAERAEEENWAAVKQRWETGVSPMPDGVIFVEQIDPAEEDPNEESGRSEMSRAWGIVVQGQGKECRPSCYLLKTNRVGSGLGHWCTHFCLVRVQSFTETAASQLTNCWLLQGI